MTTSRRCCCRSRTRPASNRNHGKTGTNLHVLQRFSPVSKRLIEYVRLAKRAAVIEPHARPNKARGLFRRDGLCGSESYPLAHVNRLSVERNPKHAEPKAAQGMSSRSLSCQARSSLLKESSDAFLRVMSDCICRHHVLCVAIGFDLIKINLPIVRLLSQSHD